HRPDDPKTDAHAKADQICFTGYPPGSDDNNVMPSCGAYAAKELQKSDPTMPAYVMIPRRVAGTGAAWLGAACNPFETIAAPADRVPFQMPSMALPAEFGAARLLERRRLLSRFDTAHLGDEAHVMARFQAQAFDILQSSRARAAFDFDKEP